MKWYTSSSFSATLHSSGTMGWGGWKLLCTRLMLSLLLIARPASDSIFAVVPSLAKVAWLTQVEQGLVPCTLLAVCTNTVDKLMSL